MGLRYDMDGGKEEGGKKAEERWTDLALHNLTASHTSNQGSSAFVHSHDVKDSEWD